MVARLRVEPAGPLGDTWETKLSSRSQVGILLLAGEHAFWPSSPVGPDFTRGCIMLQHRPQQPVEGPLEDEGG